MGNSLFRNSGDGTFHDSSASAGVGMGRWSWSSDAWDFDHDGFPDLYVANGMLSGPSRPTGVEDLNSFFWRQVVAKSPEEAKPSHDYEQGWNAINELIRSDGTWSGFERNVFYANNRDGTFSDVSGAVGLDFIEDGRAFALADFDHDGRLEVFLKNRNGPQLRVLKNVVEGLPPSIAFRLRGRKSNSDAICKPVQASFPSTAKKCFSAWEKPKALYERQFAGRVGWCRNFTTSRPITEFGLKRVSNRRGWNPSRHRDRAIANLLPSSRKKLTACLPRLKPGCSYLFPLRTFLLPT